MEHFSIWWIMSAFLYFLKIKKDIPIIEIKYIKVVNNNLNFKLQNIGKQIATDIYCNVNAGYCRLTQELSPWNITTLMHPWLSVKEQYFEFFITYRWWMLVFIRKYSFSIPDNIIIFPPWNLSIISDTVRFSWKDEKISDSIQFWWNLKEKALEYLILIAILWISFFFILKPIVEFLLIKFF